MLARDPLIANPLTVRELLEEIDRAEVLLPEIQRAYVWKSSQVTKLLDSLYMAFPTGQILLWDNGGEVVHTKTLSGVKKNTLANSSSPKIVLDGQQRLTSLHKALQGKNGMRVCFNLEDEIFQLHQKRLDSDPYWVAVEKVYRNEVQDLQVLRLIEKSGGPKLDSAKANEYLDRLRRLRAIADYKFPIEIFRNDNYETVTELFVRINSGGTRLRGAELALAQLALKLPGFIVSKFEETLEVYGDAGYDLDTRFLTRALIVIGTGQSRFRYLNEFLTRSQSALIKSWKRTKLALDSAINFSRENARFDTSAWLPTQMALLPIAAYFDKHDKLTPNVEEELLRWFYLAFARGRYSKSSETALDEDLKAVQMPSPTKQLVKNVLGGGHNDRVSVDELEEAGTRSSLFGLTYAAARASGAKDWFNGVAVADESIGDDHEVQVHHIFPKQILNAKKVPLEKRDEIANLAFLAARPNRQISATPPKEYLADIANSHPERLISQCVPMNRALWRVERFDDFLKERRKLLAERINGLIENPSQRKAKKMHA